MWIKSPTPGEWNVLGCGCMVVLLVVGGIGLYFGYATPPTDENIRLISKVRFGSWMAIAIAAIIAAVWIVIRKLNQ